jgi:DNA-binding SARP family transcriptional activator
MAQHVAPQPGDPQVSGEAISVRLLGRFRARRGDRDLGLRGRKVQELICYILLFRERCHHREVLAETLWGATAGTRSRTYLRQALWQVRELTGPPSSGNPMLRMDPQWIEVSQSADLWLDVAELEDVHALLQGVPAERIDERQADLLRRAVDAYRGELLEGCYQDWCVYERERLRMIYLAVLEKLVVYCQRRGHLSEGVLYGQMILRHDRAHENTHRRLMWLHHLAGDRTAAMRQFDRCAEILREELGVEPAKSTLALYERIRTADSAWMPAGQPAGDPATAPAWNDTRLGRSGAAVGPQTEEGFLEQCLDQLVKIQAQVRQRLFEVRRSAGD